MEITDLAMDWYDAGLELHALQQVHVRNALAGVLSADGKLDATKMQAIWFPQIQSDIFLSHSHADTRIAVALAGWLHVKLGLTCFIDSCAWGYADDLLRAIDVRYCYLSASDTYSYEKRNRSTSHVHMMLSVALSKMIDSSECVWFLNTPSSIAPREVIETGSARTTKSPWLYAELAMTKLIRRRSPAMHRHHVKLARERLDEAELAILYDVELDHLTSLTRRDLSVWSVANAASSAAHALDLLYALKPRD